MCCQVASNCCKKGYRSTWYQTSQGFRCALLHNLSWATILVFLLVPLTPACLQLKPYVAYEPKPLK